MNHLFAAILVVCLAAVSCLQLKKEIKKGCSAKTDKGVVDLTSVAKMDGTSAAFQYAGTTPGHSMSYWNPCKDTTIPGAVTPCTNPGEVFVETTGILMCLTLSQEKDASFSAKGDNLILSYESPSAGVPSHITLMCSDSVPSTPFQQTECTETPNDNCYTLTHPACCPKSSGLSIGTILLIVVLILAVCYVIGGLLGIAFIKKKAEKKTEVFSLS